jgi:hypothetical protein
MGSPKVAQSITYDQVSEGVKVQGLAVFLDTSLLAIDVWKSITGKSIEHMPLIGSINQYEQHVRKIAAVRGVPFTSKMACYYLPGTLMFFLGLALLGYSINGLTSRWTS